MYHHNVVTIKLISIQNRTNFCFLINSAYLFICFFTCRYQEQKIESDSLANYNPLNKQLAGVAIKEKRPPLTDYQRPNTEFQRPNTEFQRPNTDFQRPNTEYQRPKADLIPPSSQSGFPSLSPFGSDEYNGNFGFTRPGLEKRPVLAVEQPQRPEFSEGQNLRPKRRRPVSIFDQIPEVEQPQRPEIIESQNLRPKRRPSVFDFDENSFGRNPVRFNTVEDNNSNSPRYQQIQNETPKRYGNMGNQVFKENIQKRKKINILSKNYCILWIDIISLDIMRTVESSKIGHHFIKKTCFQSVNYKKYAPE